MVSTLNNSDKKSNEGQSSDFKTIFPPRQSEIPSFILLNYLGGMEFQRTYSTCRRVMRDLQETHRPLFCVVLERRGGTGMRVEQEWWHEE